MLVRLEDVGNSSDEFVQVVLVNKQEIVVFQYVFLCTGGRQRFFPKEEEDAPHSHNG